ncbi:MAG: PIN domain-containing protein [Thermoplasmata archaeon]|nr:PIN domain-containing protein [Thermoplasmata archaeon]MCI4338497.1 PIN domain-containing protein [Thermoplasmata archaeon]MCI4341513.1 PIN domain-containing protein [Thermoplasmata archaeon]
MRLTIDSFAWIELIRGTALGIDAKDRLEAADSCFTPAIVLAEVALQCFRDGLGDGQIQQEMAAITESSAVVPIRPELALAAAAATAELRSRARSLRLGRPGLSDGLVLATARATGSRLLTGDPHFRQLAETDWLG